MVDEKSLLSTGAIFRIRKWSVDLSMHSLFAIEKMQKLSQ